MAVLGNTSVISLTLLDGVIGNLNPKTTNVYTLGTSSLKWNNVYATTFTGNLTGNVTGNITGNLTGNATIQAANGFTYSGIGTASDNAARPIWFAYNGVNGRPVIDNDFKYNPANNTITIGTGSLSPTQYSGNAATATTASKLSNTSAVGAADRPVYFTNGGVPSQTTYRMAATNVSATGARAITDNLETGIWYVNGTNVTGLYSQSDGAAYVNKYSDSWIAEIYQDYRTGQIAIRGKNNGTWQAWRQVLDSSNYTSYTVTKTGTGASGTWGISISGNAATATKFASAQSVTLTGDVTGTASSTNGWSIATTLTNSGATAGSYGDSGAQTPAYGATFKVPYITVDAKGRVTAISEHTVKIPASDNTDAKVTQTATTTSAAYEILFSATADNTTRTEGARKTSTLTYNPSTKALVTGGTVDGYDLNAASAKGVDTSMTVSSTSTNLPTTAAVAALIASLDFTSIGVAAATGNRFVSQIAQTDGKISAALSTATIGSSHQPVYVDAGTIKPIDNVDLKEELDGIETIIGTQTAKTNAWTGTSTRIKKLYSGLTIRYYLPWDGTSSNATLNLTLADGTTTGAINCYYSSGRLTSHYQRGQVVTFTYFAAGDIAINGTATTDNRWIADANYDSNNNDTGYYVRRIYPNIKAGANKIFPYTIIMQNADGRWESLVTSSSTGTTKTCNAHGFVIGQMLLMYANATYNENANVATYNIWSLHSGLIDHRYSFNTANNATDGTTGYKPVYLVGTIGNDGLFYLDTTEWWTQSLPTTEDGKVYIYVGDAYDYYRLTYAENHPAYEFVDGHLQLVVGKATKVGNAATNAVVYTTNANGTIATKASANGALYATSANGALQWGTLPVSQGGTGQTTFTANAVLIGNGTNGISTISKTNANTANTLVQRDGSGNFSAGTITATLSGNASTATKTGVASMWLYPENNNELNFGGTNNSTTIFFGYRTKDSKAIPTKFIFGGSTGTAEIQVKTVCLGSGTSSYISSTQYTGNAATATKFASAQSVTLTGDVTGTTSSQAGWSIATTIGAGKVTNAMLAGSIANAKLANSSITVGSKTISLGGSATLAEIGAAAASHTHGSITNDGKLGTASRAVVTDANKNITVADLTVNNPTDTSSEAISFIDTISQNAQGKITPTRKSVRVATTSDTGVVKVGTGLGVSSGTISVTYGTSANTALQGNQVLFKLNNSDKTASSAAAFYAPTAGGTAGYPLIGAGTTTAPAWYGGTVFTGTAAASWKTDFNGTTDATSTTTAAVVMDGGLGVAKQLRTGGSVTLGTLDGNQHVINGSVRIESKNGSYNEGLRINRSTTGYANIYLGGTRNSTSGNQAGGWWIGTLSTPADASSTSTSTYFQISHNSTSTNMAIRGTWDSGWIINPRLTVGTATLSTTYTFYVNGTSYFNNNMIIEKATASTTKATGALVIKGTDAGLGVAGQVNAETFRVNEKVKLEYNATDDSLDFVWA